MKILKSIFEAIISSDLDEYYDALILSYINQFSSIEETADFINFLKDQDEQTSRMFNIDIKVQKEDNGTLLIAYGENDQYIILFGLVSNKTKMNRYDIPAIKQWINNLIEKMKEGKKFLTTPNNESFKLIDHIEDAVKNDPSYTLNKNVGPAVDIRKMGIHIKNKNFGIYRQVSLSLT